MDWIAIGDNNCALGPFHSYVVASLRKPLHGNFLCLVSVIAAEMLYASSIGNLKAGLNIMMS